MPHSSEFANSIKRCQAYRSLRRPLRSIRPKRRRRRRLESDSSGYKEELRNPCPVFIGLESGVGNVIEFGNQQIICEPLIESRVGLS